MDLDRDGEQQEPDPSEGARYFVYDDYEDESSLQYCQFVAVFDDKLAREMFDTKNWQGSGSSTYQLRITGDDVSFPAPAAEMETAAETMTATANIEPVVTSEENIVAAAETTQIDGQWRSVNSQNPATFTFAYAGDNEQVTLKMEVSPSDSVSFAVWTPAQWAEHNRGEDVDPVGRGSAEKEDVLTWSGSFNQAGEYVVTVEAAGAKTGYYALTIE
jgi:hypothetical protein